MKVTRPHLKNMMGSLFEEMIHLFIEQNYITMENYFLDGTKIGADAISILLCGKNNEDFRGKAERKNLRNDSTYLRSNGI